MSSRKAGLEDEPREHDREDELGRDLERSGADQAGDAADHQARDDQGDGAGQPA